MPKKTTSADETGEFETEQASAPAEAEQSPPVVADPRADVRVYIGPTMHRRAIVGASVYRGGLNAHVAGLVAKVPEIAALIVPLSDIVEAKRKAKEPGTTEYGVYQYLLSVRFDENGEVRG
jgi:hypothetical protein